MLVGGVLGGVLGGGGGRCHGGTMHDGFENKRAEESSLRNTYWN